ncbi:MAG: primosomal protein N' [Pyrinomonadaceae bacterium]
MALPLPLRRTFTYGIPSGLRAATAKGSRLLVPFGKRNLTGYVVELHDELDPGLGLAEVNVKDAIELLDETPLITAEILELTRWAADYYAASWGEMLKASLPAGINKASERILSINDIGREDLEKADAKGSRFELLRYLSDHGETPQKTLEKKLGEVSARRHVRELLAAGSLDAYFRSTAAKVSAKLQKAVRLIEQPGNEDDQELTKPQSRILDILRSGGGEILYVDLLAKANVSASPINTLARQGRLEVFATEIFRDPLDGAQLPEISNLKLNPEQRIALSTIEKAVADRGYKAFLLHGVTGSGKTEVYIRAMRHTLTGGRSALMLVPEIALTPIFSRRLKAAFGSQVAILHSNLSPGERFDEWRRIYRGEARVVIGTRSAIFAPLKDIGLIVVDEEHDASYRQQDAPYYNARDSAVMRANMAGAVVVLGSATPSLESFENARSGKYVILKLRNRIGNRPLARAELVDMREVFRQAGKDIVISKQLAEAIKNTHAKGEQSIILLNRRGFSQFVLCRSCGESLRCKNCDITLTYHRGDPKLICHYCGFRAQVPKRCPFCDGEYLYFIGQGTEQLETMLRRQFPDLDIARIDRDTMHRKGELARTLLAFDRGEIDMLVGTQMLAKGHDFHNVTLVGVISVDTGLGLPDLRSAERTFQLITQVAGRAGRGDLAGRVLIQTYYPEHYALRHAVRQDYEGFFNQEIRYRERMGYPPFVVLAQVLVRHSDLNAVVETARIIREGLDAANADKACRILGPAPASLARLKGEHRFQILIKASNRKTLREVIELGLDKADEKGAQLRFVQIEIDPINML